MGTSCNACPYPYGFKRDGDKCLKEGFTPYRCKSGADICSRDVHVTVAIGGKVTTGLYKYLSINISVGLPMYKEHRKGSASQYLYYNTDHRHWSIGSTLRDGYIRSSGEGNRACPHEVTDWMMNDKGERTGNLSLVVIIRAPCLRSQGKYWSSS